jgi:hypothetical protein
MSWAAASSVIRFPAISGFLTLETEQERFG